MTDRSIVTIRTRVESISQSGSLSLIDRYAGSTDHPTRLRYDVPGHLGIDLTLIDTSSPTVETPASPAGHTSLWHVIWIRNEEDATATVTMDSARETWPIAPGDSLLVPPAASLSTTGGYLALSVRTKTQPASESLFAPPTHGVERYVEYNRQTIYPELAGMVSARWKITQPLDLSRHHPTPIIVFSLAGDPAIATQTESLTLRRGQAVLVKGNQGASVYPNGLGYVFVIESRAGHDR